MATSIPANNNTGLYNTVGGSQPLTGNVVVTNLSATGNITAGGNFVGNGAALTGVVAANSTYANTAGYATTAGTANTAGSANTAAYVTANAQANITTVGTLTSLSVTGNVQGGNLRTVGLVSATGNITGNYILGNGSQLSGLPIPNLANYTGSISATGNITAGANILGQYILGNGSQLTGLPATYSNAQVSSYLASGTNTANIITTANITGGNLTTTGTGGNITGVNFASANYFVGDGSYLTNVTATTTYNDSNVVTLLAGFGSNTVSTTGNISAGYFIGNGSQLTGIAASSYGNANVNTLLAAWGSNSLSTTGNVTAGYVFGNGSQLTGLPATYSNANVTTLLASFGSNSISTTGNVTASYVVGNGSLLTSLTGANVSGQVANALVAGTVYTAAQPNITSVGTLTSLSVAGKVTSGAVAYANTDGTNGQVLTTYGNGITYFSTPSGGSYGNANVTTLMAGFGSNTISTTGNISAGYFVGNGSLLTGIAASSYSNANVANYLPTYSGDIGNSAVSGNISIGTPSGIVFFNNGTGANGVSIRPSNTTSNVNLFLNAANLNIGTGSSNVLIGNTTSNVTIGANLVVAGGSIRTTAATASVFGSATTISIGGTSATGINLGPSAGGVLATINGNANVTNTLNVVGNITTAGILTNGYYYANGVPVTFGGGSSYGDSNVNTLLAAWGSNTLSTTGNVTLGNLLLTGNIVDSTGVLQLTSAGNINLVPTSTVAVTGAVSATGNINAGNVIATNIGNVAALNLNGNASTVLYGNGVFAAVSGGGGTYGDSNVNTLLSAWGSNSLSTTGNVTAGNVITPNVYTSNITGAAGQTVTITADGTGDIHLDADSIRIGDNNTDATLVTHGTGNLILRTHEGDASQGNITLVNGVNGNIQLNPNGTGLVTTTVISATGNITGSYILGNGSQLTGLPATYGNSNVTTLLAAFGSNTISTSGNITSGNIIATNIGNVAALNLNGNASTVLYGNGVFAAVAGGGSYGDSNVVTLMSAFGSNTISTTGAVSTGNITLRTNGRIFGDWGNATTNSKTFFQSSNVSAGTLVAAIPPVGYAPGNTTLLSGWWSYANADAGNTAFVYTAINSGTDARIRSGNTGTGTALPLTIYVGTTATERFRIDLNGNVGMGCTAPNSALVVGSYTGTSVQGASDILLTGNINVQGGFVRVGTPNSTGTLFNTAGTVNIGTTSAVGVNIGSTLGATTTINGNANVTNTLTFANIARSGGAPTAATDTTIAYKVPIVINGTTYYIALTAAV
jgi:hypothetical protein